MGELRVPLAEIRTPGGGLRGSCGNKRSSGWDMLKARGLWDTQGETSSDSWMYAPAAQGGSELGAEMGESSTES